ncbi:uncharacterized protein PG998_003078 [Apiospora kogelbergensis]|uniref:uncharacterized protein n=1 Tax=Apiospora kogelbergensis TaxID=1337665 RepID=UPI00312CEB4D
MPAVAAIVNQAVPDGKSINLFYNTEKAQLAVAYKSGAEGDDPDTAAWAADATDYAGHIFNPSSIASDYYRGNQLVVAVTEPKTDCESKPVGNQISLVSPVYKKLATTSLSNKTFRSQRALHIAGRNEATLLGIYSFNSQKLTLPFFPDTSGTTKGQTRLKEYNIDTGNVATFLQNQDVALNCSLAAWYDPAGRARMVVYQEFEEGHLKGVQRRHQASLLYLACARQLTISRRNNIAWDIDGTGDAKDLTTVAVSCVNGKTYLYYTDSKNNVRRVIKDKDGWGGPRTVSGLPKVGTSQLTVAASNGYNHLFYVSVEDTNPGSFQHARDPL